MGDKEELDLRQEDEEESAQRLKKGSPRDDELEQGMTPVGLNVAIEEPDGSWIIVVAVSVAAIIHGIMYGSFSLLYKAMSEDLGIGMADAGWVGSAFGAACAFPGENAFTASGRYGDIEGISG